MRKTVFFVIIILTLQGFSQVEKGVYTSKAMYEYEFNNGEQIGGGLSLKENTYIHFGECGFRVYVGSKDAGNTFPSVYVGKTEDGYEMYGLYPDDRAEYKDNNLYIFYNFNDDSGYYDSSTEFHGLEYIGGVPDLLDEKEER